jgi:hypothetical protein
MKRKFGILGVALVTGAATLSAQRPVLEHRSMSGPRLGLTYAFGPRADSVLREHGLQPVLSQFGWHFEQQVVPRGGGPEFVIEEVLLVGGVEQRTAIPSATVLMGIRMPNGFEFGLGPNLSPTGSALAIGIGKSISYGGVSLPVNLALVRSPGATRMTVLVGYALETSDQISR